jgi:hypothetical protein
MEIQDHTGPHTKSLLVIVRIMDERESRFNSNTTVQDHSSDLVDPDALSAESVTFRFDHSGLPIYD